MTPRHDTHVAPLGLKTGNSRPLYIWHSVGAKDGRCYTLLYAAKRRLAGAIRFDTHVAPLG